MFKLKCSAQVVILAVVIQSVLLISVAPNSKESAETLWKLSHLALQKQALKYPSQSQLNPEQFSKYTGLIKPSSVYNKELQSGDQELNFPKLMAARRPEHYNKRFRQRYQPQSIGGALQSIAQNDQLGCVPRLLCELTSGPNSEVGQGSILPFNLNMEPIIGLVTALSGTMSNPLLEFGRAALLGYTSKGNSRACMFAYPQCPQDADKLVEYLNNNNGGFFKYFNGAPQEQQQQQQPYYPHLQQPYYPQLQQLLPRPHQYSLQPYHRRTKAQKRILSHNSGIKFSNNFEVANREKLVFPKRDDESYRKPLIKQPMIFPDRTGTGELRLDPDELQISDSTYFDFRKPKQSGNFKFPFNQ